MNLSFKQIRAKRLLRSSESHCPVAPQGQKHGNGGETQEGFQVDCPGLAKAE